MAEFVRIWDETTQNYVEYDTTIIESETVYVPVSNISISRPIQTGTVNKIIDTNDVTKRSQSLEISQIQKFITIEKSYTDRFSIERSNATSVNIESSRNNIIVNTSGIGQRGEKGQKGEDGINSIAEFFSVRTYKTGELVFFESGVWTAKIDLDGTETPLISPAEGGDWTQVADRQYVEDLPLVSSYLVSKQSEWEAIRDDIVFGDLIRSSSSFLLTEGQKSTTNFTIQSIGAPMQDQPDTAYHVHSKGANIIFFSTLGPTRSAEKFIALIASEGIVTGGDLDGQQGKTFGSANPPSTPIYFGNGAIKHFKSYFQSLDYADLISYTVYGSAGVQGIADTSIINNPNAVRDYSFYASRFFGKTRPGLEIPGDNHGFSRGDVISNLDGSKIQIIQNVNVFSGNTFYDVDDYTVFETGDEIYIRTSREKQIVANQWYAKNEVLFINSVLDDISISTSEIAKLATVDFNAEENKIQSVKPNGQLKIDNRVLSIDSTQESVGTASGGKVLRLRSDGRISPTVFGQVNLSETETFLTTDLRNAFTGRAWTAGGVAIITGDPAVTDSPIGTFVYEGAADKTFTEDSDWVEIVTPTGAVASVAGKAGVVILAIEDIETLETALGDKADKSTIGNASGTRFATQTDIDNNVIGSDGNAVDEFTDTIDVASTGIIEDIETNASSIGDNYNLIKDNTSNISSNDGDITTLNTAVGSSSTVNAGTNVYPADGSGLHQRIELEHNRITAISTSSAPPFTYFALRIEQDESGGRIRLDDSPTDIPTLEDEGWIIVTGHRGDTFNIDSAILHHETEDSNPQQNGT